MLFTPYKKNFFLKIQNTFGGETEINFCFEFIECLTKFRMKMSKKQLTVVILP